MMEKADSALPAPVLVPVPQPAGPAEAAGSPAQQAFRQALAAVEGLREQLRERRAGQAAARRRYWQQVGPVAAAVVAARRALYTPLEAALLLDGYFSRQEIAQLTELILNNAETLQTRFGEDETAIIGKYAPRPPADSPHSPAAEPRPPAGPNPAAGPPTPTVDADLHAEFSPDLHPEFGPDPARPAHEQAAAARARRLTKAQRAQEAAAQAAHARQQQLAANTKGLYRQLARAHHPDLAPDPSQHAARTAQMQRITAAYAAADFYALLQLLAESGPANADPDPADRLAPYTLALRAQQRTLQQQLTDLSFDPDSGGLAVGTGRQQERALRHLKRALRAEAAAVQQLAQQLAEGPAGVRELLREYRAVGPGQ